MCGIAGLARFDGAPADTSAVRRMMNALAHRGPDGEGLWHDGGVALGHRRLAIRDLSAAGQQPMLDDQGIVCVTYNGEIYNYAALRRAIETESSYRFRSTCDTELLPIGWRLWGEDLFARIEGMFALALWDRSSQTLVLVRDGIGIKPLFVARAGDAWLFASELKGLLAASMIPIEIEPESFHTYLAAGYTDRDRTLIRGVTQLPPGTVRRIDRTGVTERRYWQPRRNPLIHNLDEAAEAVRACLTEVTSDMLAADVPLGLLLSSGVDSALLALSLRDRVVSYTASFACESHDEAAGAREIARVADCPWTSIPVDESHTVTADFCRAALAVDGQLADSSCLAHYALCRAVRREVKVALAGDGADEFFAGYPTYFASRLASVIAPLVPRRLAAYVGEWFSIRGARGEERLPWQDVAARFCAAFATGMPGHHAEWRRLTPAALLPELYGATMRPLLDRDPLREYRQAALGGSGGVLDRCLLADQTIYLPGDMLVKVDRASMAHGLEIRVPFLDRRVMDLAGTLNGALLAPLGGPNKRVLRRILGANGAPRDALERPKLGFNVPLARLLRQELRALGDEFIETDTDLFEPLLAPDALRAIWRAHRDGQRNHGYALWAILVYGVWRRAV